MNEEKAKEISDKSDKIAKMHAKITENAEY